MKIDANPLTKNRASDPLRKYPMYFTCEFHVVLCEAHVEHTEERVFHMFCPKYT